MGSARPRFARLSRRASPGPSSASHTAASIRPAHAARPSCPCLSGPSSASPMAVSIRRAHVTPGPYRHVCPDARPVLARLAYGRKAVGLIQPDPSCRAGVERRPQPRPRSRLMRPALGPSLMPGVERLASAFAPLPHARQRLAPTPRRAVCCAHPLCATSG